MMFDYFPLFHEYMKEPGVKREEKKKKKRKSFQVLFLRVGYTRINIIIISNTYFEKAESPQLVCIIIFIGVTLYSYDTYTHI